MAARAALWDTHVPITRPIEYKAPQRPSGDTMVESGLDTRQLAQAADFELKDYWSEGDVLDGRDRWPVCITLNLVRENFFVVCET
jgi:exosome complex component RRP42